MTLKNYFELVLGINRIAFEMLENHKAFVGIMNNNNFVGDRPIPIALMMLLKNHFQVYVIESSKILLPGKDQHFLIATALNTASSNPTLTNEARAFRKKLSALNPILVNLRTSRNKIFAHLDRTYLSYKNLMTDENVEKINETVQVCVNFLNESIGLPKEVDYRFMERGDIIAFYDFVFTEIVNTNCVKTLPKVDPVIFRREPT